MLTFNSRFIVDDMAGKLARWLRIIGFDTAHQSSISDGELIGRAFREGRIILTRDTRLVASRALPPYLLIRSPFLDKQLLQMMGEMNLKFIPGRVFTRCSDCNRLLEPVENQSIQTRVPPYVYQHQKEFFSCPSCGKIFWKGSHHQKVSAKLRHLFDRLEEG